MKHFEDFFNEAQQYPEILKQYNENGKVFKDSNFHPNSEIKESNLEFNKENYTWRRVDDFYKTPLFKKGSISEYSIQQGELNDSYLIGSLIRIAKQPNLVENLFDTRTKQNEKESINLKCGAVVIYFHVFGKRTPVLIDTLIPFQRGTRIPIFSRPSNIKCSAWFCLVEKAYAKLQGSYSSITNGNLSQAIYHLFGYYPCYYTISNILEKREKTINSNEENDESEYLFSNLMKWQYENAVIGSIINTNQLKSDNITEDYIKDNGLVTSQTYLIQKIRQEEDKNFVCLRNPKNDHEWLGKWSNSSNLWTCDMKRKLGFEPQNDGTFWMNDKDFFSYFSTFDVAKPLNPENHIKSIKTQQNEHQTFAFKIKNTSEESNENDIPTVNNIKIHLIVEKRTISENPNSQLNFSIVYSKGQKIESSEIDHYNHQTFTSSQPVSSFTFDLLENDPFIIVFEKENEDEVYATFCCKNDFDLFDIDKPNQLSEEDEKIGIVFNNESKRYPNVARKIVSKNINNKAINCYESEDMFEDDSIFLPFKNAIEQNSELFEYDDSDDDSEQKMIIDYSKYGELIEKYFGRSPDQMTPSEIFECSFKKLQEFDKFTENLCEDLQIDPKENGLDSIYSTLQLRLNSISQIQSENDTLKNLCEEIATSIQQKSQNLSKSSDNSIQNDRGSANQSENENSDIVRTVEQVSDFSESILSRNGDLLPSTLFTEEEEKLLNKEKSKQAANEQPQNNDDQNEQNYFECELECEQEGATEEEEEETIEEGKEFLSTEPNKLTDDSEITSSNVIEIKELSTETTEEDNHSEVNRIEPVTNDQKDNDEGQIEFEEEESPIDQSKESKLDSKSEENFDIQNAIIIEEEEEDEIDQNKSGDEEANDQFGLDSSNQIEISIEVDQNEFNQSNESQTETNIEEETAENPFKRENGSSSEIIHHMEFDYENDTQTQSEKSIENQIQAQIESNKEEETEKQSDESQNEIKNEIQIQNQSDFSVESSNELPQDNQHNLNKNDSTTTTKEETQIQNKKDSTSSTTKEETQIQNKNDSTTSTTKEEKQIQNKNRTKKQPQSKQTSENKTKQRARSVSRQPTRNTNKTQKQTASDQSKQTTEDQPKLAIETQNEQNTEKSLENENPNRNKKEAPAQTRTKQKTADKNSNEKSKSQIKKKRSLTSQKVDDSSLNSSPKSPESTISLRKKKRNNSTIVRINPNKNNSELVSNNDSSLKSGQRKVRQKSPIYMNIVDESAARPKHLSEFEFEDENSASKVWKVIPSENPNKPFILSQEQKGQKFEQTSESENTKNKLSLSPLLVKEYDSSKQSSKSNHKSGLKITVSNLQEDTDVSISSNTIKVSDKKHQIKSRDIHFSKKNTKENPKKNKIESPEKVRSEKVHSENDRKTRKEKQINNNKGSDKRRCRSVKNHDPRRHHSSKSDSFSTKSDSFSIKSDKISIRNENDDFSNNFASFNYQEKMNQRIKRKRRIENQDDDDEFKITESDLDFTSKYWDKKLSYQRAYFNMKIGADDPFCANIGTSRYNRANSVSSHSRSFVPKQQTFMEKYNLNDCQLNCSYLPNRMSNF